MSKIVGAKQSGQVAMYAVFAAAVAVFMMGGVVFGCVLTKTASIWSLCRMSSLQPLLYALGMFASTCDHCSNSYKACCRQQTRWLVVVE